MHDPLSDVLRSLRLTGGVFLDVRLTAPWCVVSELTAEDCRPHLQRAAQLISFHVLLSGSMLIDVAGEPCGEAAAGEIVLLPRNDAHMLASERGIPAVPGRSLVVPSPDGGLARVVHGGPGDLTHMVCGFLGSDEVATPLLATLPSILKLDLRKGTSREWIEASVRFAAQELADGRLASSSVMSRLSEVLLTEAIRQYAAGLPETEVGWLRGLGDPQVGRALASIHRDMAAPWTAEELARSVAMSRSAFVERFTALVGTPPIRYLTALRLNSARLELRDTSRSVGELAHRVGYESEEAFSRAFKREYGLSPAHWRERAAEA